MWLYTCATILFEAVEFFNNIHTTCGLVLYNNNDNTFVANWILIDHVNIKLGHNAVLPELAELQLQNDQFVNLAHSEYMP